MPTVRHPLPGLESEMALQMSLSVCDYDRTRALFDGRAPIEGCDVIARSARARRGVPSRIQVQRVRHQRNLAFELHDDDRARRLRTTSRFRPSYRGCSVTAASTSAPIAASPSRRTSRARPSACRNTRSPPMSGSGASCRTSTASSRATSNGATAASRKPAATSARPSSCRPTSTSKPFRQIARSPTCWKQGRSTA